MYNFINLFLGGLDMCLLIRMIGIYFKEQRTKIILVQNTVYKILCTKFYELFLHVILHSFTLDWHLLFE